MFPKTGDRAVSNHQTFPDDGEVGTVLTHQANGRAAIATLKMVS
jgi:hypothetical protein